MDTPSTAPDIDRSVDQVADTADVTSAVSTAAAQQTATAPHLGTSESTPTLSSVDVGLLFDRWNASLRTLDPSKVVANYASRSLLLPTLSGVPRFSDAEKLDYFRHFLAKRPVGMIDTRQISAGSGMAIDCGHYTFYLEATGETVPARYTFTYGYENGQWLITSHHSSACPTE